MDKKIKKSMFKKLICIFCQKNIDISDNNHKCERRMTNNIIIHYVN